MHKTQTPARETAPGLTHYYAWELVNGERHFSPKPTTQAMAEAHVRAMNERSGPTRWFAVPAHEVDAWQEAEVITDPPVARDEVMISCTGSPILARHVQPRIRLEDQTVRNLVANAADLQERMREFREGAFSDVRAFLAILLNEYNVDREGRRGGITLMSFDQTMKVEVSVADQLTLGPEIEAAKALIDDCVLDWSEGANSNLRTVVMDAFKVGENGRISVDRVVGLRSLKIDDPRWLEAMNAISDAIRKTSSRSYIRFYERADSDAQWKLINLNMASL